MKSPDQKTEQPQDDKKDKNSAHLLRHSISGYKTYKEAIKSEDPQAAVDYDKQVTPDMPEAGIELAKNKAVEFFKTLDPETDAIFFVSSNEARALETANIYREEARKQGFEIIKPEHIRNNLADEIGKGEIRAVNTLSLNIDNALLGSVFNPDKYLGEINWEAIDQETKKKWDKAREIINSDDKGSWGGNFHHHSEEIQKIFPEIKSAKNLYERQFKNVLKLVNFGMDKIEKANINKNVKIIGFGHENYLTYALDKYFKDHSMDYCEAIEFDVDEGGIKAKFRDQEKRIE